MIKKLLRHIDQGRDFAGVEIIEKKGQLLFSYILLREEKGELNLIEAVETKSLDSLAAIIPKTIPVSLVINTDQVISKLGSAIGTDNAETLLQKQFPNLSLENFYYQGAQLASTPLISIAKREYVDGVIEEILANKLKLVGVFLGPAPIVNLLFFLNIKTITTTRHKMEIEDGQILDLKNLNTDRIENVDLGGMVLNSQQLLAFSAVMDFVNPVPLASNLYDINTDMREDFRYSRRFSLGLKATLIIVLFSLLLNFLTFSYYFDRSEDLSSQLEMIASDQEEWKKLYKAVSEKEEKITILSRSGASRVSYYLDQIANQIPGSILLDKLIYQPLKKPIKPEKQIILQEGSILLSGISNDPEAFDNWLRLLEKEAWVSTVETSDYGYSSRNHSRFSIELKLEDAK